ncbi:MAG: Ig-like domain-containing protein [Gemmatimonadaceae bacterium]
MSALVPESTLPDRISLVHHRLARSLVLGISVLLLACGSGGGDEPTAPPVPIVAVVLLTTPTDTVAIGDTVALVAHAQTSSGQSVDNVQFNWTSSDTSVARVDQLGRMTLIAVGATTVVAKAVAPLANVPTPVSGERTLAVKNLIRTITLARAAGTDTVAMGDTIRVAATARDGSGNVVAGAQFSWSVSDTSLAQVDSGGVVIARAMGGVTVSALATGPSDFVHGRVTAATQMKVRLFLTSISSGVSEHTCGVGRGGVVYCWGSGSSGQIGNGATSAPGAESATPVRVSSADRFASVAVGPDNSSDGGHACGITIGGALDCWGSGAYGMLGDGFHGEGNPVYSVAAPVRVSPGPYETLSAGVNTSCALATSGDTYCAGSNYMSQLGVDTVPELCGQDDAGGAYIAGCSTKFLHIPAPAFVSLSQGGGTTCGLTSAGQAWCWGRNTLGNSGVGYATPVAAPSQMVGGISFSSISIGAIVGCGVTSAGAAYCWGGNQFGTIGNGVWSTDVGIPPTAVQSPVAFTAIAVGGSHACGLTAGGDVYCWGSNRFGELGSPTTQTCGPPGTGGTAPCSPQPVQVQSAPKFAAITAGAAFTCGLTSLGATYCWGSSEYGQLGNGTTTGSSTVPVRVTDIQ